MTFPTPKDWGDKQTRTDERQTADETETETGEPDFPDDMTKPELKAAITKYQEWCAEHYDELDIDLDGIPVEVSNKMKRTAGKVARIKGSDEVKFIRYAYKSYQHEGWEKFTETIRHELIHVHTIQNYAKGGHGRLFKSLVDPLDTTRHCESFANDDAKYILFCTECDQEIGRRFQKSKVVKRPGDYNSKCCGASLRVEDNR